MVQGFVFHMAEGRSGAAEPRDTFGCCVSCDVPLVTGKSVDNICLNSGGTTDKKFALRSQDLGAFLLSKKKEC